MEQTFNHVEIRSCGNSDEPSATTELYLNGHKLNGVRSYRLEQSAGNLPRLILDLTVLRVSVDSNVTMFDKVYGEEMEIHFKDNDAPQSAISLNADDSRFASE